MAGPLVGLTVIELAGIGPGPFACMTLADMGADVIRVDRPVGPNLATAPPAADVLNRGKRSIVLDLKRPEAVEVVLALDGSDACVAPVLSLREAPSHPHVAARGSVTDGLLAAGVAVQSG